MFFSAGGCLVSPASPWVRFARTELSLVILCLCSVFRSDVYVFWGAQTRTQTVFPFFFIFSRPFMFFCTLRDMRFSLNVLVSCVPPFFVFSKHFTRLWCCATAGLWPLSKLSCRRVFVVIWYHPFDLQPITRSPLARFTSDAPAADSQISRCQRFTQPSFAAYRPSHLTTTACQALSPCCLQFCAPTVSCAQVRRRRCCNCHVHRRSVVGPISWRRS